MDSHSTSDEIPLPELVTGLIHGSLSLPWPDRRDLVERAVTLLRSNTERIHAYRLLTHLAIDAKWEVRKAVADQLLHIPETLYEQLLPLLSNDPNTYVADSVRREMGRRSIQSAGEKRRQSRPVKRAMDEIETRFGPEALRQALKLAEKKTEQVIRTAVHDIRGILTPIKPALESLHDAASDRTSKRRIDRVSSGIKYLEQMLADMRQWSDEIELTLSEEDLAEIIECAAQDAMDHLHAQGRGSRHVAFHLHAAQRPRLRVSRPQLQMAFTNIIKNAIEAHAITNTEFAVGSVSVHVSVLENALRVEIMDTGKGLNAKDLEKLLEFIPGNTSKKHLGTGYGMPIAKRYLEAHGATLRITSEPDCGTTVAITFPYESKAPSNPAP